MTRAPRRAAVVALAALAIAPARAWAYRPFDQTDADVAPPREVELELGPFAVVHTSGAGTTLAPGFVFNYGVVRRLELVVEDHNQFPVGSSSAPRTSESEPSVLVKGILREGVMQEQTGPSVALEVGALLPTLPHPDGFGAASTLIVSLRWPAATVHANAELDYSREHQLEALGGAIVEGPHTWRIRPVAEAYIQRESEGTTRLSALGGAIWELRERLSVDAAARAARDAGAALFELRLGLTWAFAL
ncbi:MAG TPA: hypothetical protein VN903_20465 [Polyangia bacterium]|jgi:hypothetical protein|nr:hypothetical protein [Polyangia bacterium]